MPSNSTGKPTKGHGTLRQGDFHGPQRYSPRALHGCHKQAQQKNQKLHSKEFPLEINMCLFIDVPTFQLNPCSSTAFSVLTKSIH